MKPQLSIIVPTLNAGLGLKTTLNSLLQQQTAPKFEVLVVSQWPFAELEAELKAWDPRFKYLCSGQKGINTARNFGLKEAQGEYVLFLDDESWIDDRLYLKKHIDTHQKFLQAIGVGGPYLRKVDANVFELAYFISSSWRVMQGRNDFFAATQLFAGNMSFKTIALRSAFAFDERAGVGASTKSLTDRLIEAGHELHFTERLSIEHRPKFGILGFVFRAVSQGFSRAKYENIAPQFTWKFAGQLLTRERYMQESRIKKTKALACALGLYDFAYSAGQHLALEKPKRSAISAPQAAGTLLKQLGFSLRMLPYSHSLTGLFLTLRSFRHR